MGEIAAGELTRRVEIQTRTLSKAAAGGEKEDWETIPSFSVWAKVEAVRGLERFVQAMEQRFATSTMKVTIRRSSKTENLSPAENRLLYRGKVYEIESVDEVGQAGIPEGFEITATLKGA